MTPSTTISAAPQAKAGPSRDAAGARDERLYIYCICDWIERVSLGPVGVGDPGAPGPEAFTIPHGGLAAVVSTTGPDKYEISRKNLLAHQKVMEAVMAAGHTVLPVRFNTIAEAQGDRPAEQNIVQRVLTGRGAELKSLVDYYADRIELGVKGLWTDMNEVYARIVRDNPDVASLRGTIAAGCGWGQPRAGEVSLRMHLGERVKKALDARKLADRGDLISSLSQTVCDMRENAIFGDPMFANLSLLVEREAIVRFEAALSGFEDAHASGTTLRYVGPLPPSSFLELVIDWEG